MDFLFEKIKTKQIQVDLPEISEENAIRDVQKKLPFQVTHIQTGPGRSLIDPKTQPEILSLSPSHLKKLALKVRIFEPSLHLSGVSIHPITGALVEHRSYSRSDINIPLSLPPKLEVGKTYTLAVSCHPFCHSFKILAQVVQEDAPIKKETRSDEREAGMDEFNLPLKDTEEAFIEQKMKNIRLDSTIDPKINTPQARVLLNRADLGELSISELQKSFDDTVKQDEAFKTQRIQANINGDRDQLYRIAEAELINSQNRILLCEALERNGIQP